MTVIVKVGYLDGANGIENTHWFHSSYQCLAIAMDAQDLERFRATPNINLVAPSRAMASNGPRIKEWLVADWVAQCSSLAPHNNPFLQKSSGENGSSILIPQ